MILTLRPTVACSACGERVTVTAVADISDAEVMTVHLDPTDRIWLDLFADAHNGPIIST